MGTSGCESCGARSTALVGSGLCPACLLALALIEPDDAPDGADIVQDLRSAAVLAALDGDADRTVYLAERRGSRQLLALEVVRASSAGPTTPGTFAARVEELRRLSHPGIAAVLGGWITAEGDYCLASEYVAGTPLERYGPAQHVRLEERLALFLAACRALEHAHASGVLHGRLRAGSIVVTRRGGEMGAVTTGFGLLPGIHATQAADVAALGVILEGVVGEEPGPAADCARRVAAAIRAAEVSSVSALVARLLAG